MKVCLHSCSTLQQYRSCRSLFKFDEFFDKFQNCLIDRYIIYFSYFCIIGIQIELWHINLKVFFDYIGGEPLVHSIIGSSESRKVFWTEQIISSLFIGTMEEIPSKINKPAWIGMANLATLHKNPLDLKLKKIVNKNSRGKLSA